MSDENQDQALGTPPIRRKRGKPFPQGNKLGKKWQPGQSGNPTGRPRTGPEFRERCRDLASQAIEMIADSLAVLEPLALLRALEVLSDRGGFLTGDKLAAAEVARLRVVLDALANPAVPQAEKEKLLERHKLHEQEVLAEVPQVAA